MNFDRDEEDEINFNRDEMDFDRDKFAEFLELPYDKTFEVLTGCKLYWWQRIYINFFCRWWDSVRKLNPRLSAIDLWESIYKGRF